MNNAAVGYLSVAANVRGLQNSAGDFLDTSAALLGIRNVKVSPLGLISPLKTYINVNCI